MDDKDLRETAPNEFFALIISIASYDRLHRLPKVVLKDALDMAAVLVDPRHGCFPESNVTIVLDEEATRERLMQELATLAEKAGVSSTILIYYSGHGGRIESGEQKGEYLLPSDTDFTNENSIARTAILGSAFSLGLQALRSRRVVVFLDCCHSAGLGNLKGTPTAFTCGLPQEYYERLQAGRGRVIIASSRSTEVSWVMPEDENSLFTHHLLVALRGEASARDGLVRIFDIFEYLQPRVTQEQPLQHPVFKAELEDNFAIALGPTIQPNLSSEPHRQYLYDAYVSFVEKEPDASWVRQILLPNLESEGLLVAISNDVEEPGVARVVSIERGIEQSKRILLVLSPAYLADEMAHFVNILGQTIGIESGAYRLLPIKSSSLNENALPARLRMLASVDLSRRECFGRELQRLVKALKGPLPRTETKKR